MQPIDSSPLGAQSLDALRGRLRDLIALGAVEELARFAEGLLDDPRRGAKAMLQSAQRIRANLVEEHERVARMFELRRTLFASGYHLIAGVDEVGVGPLAGPVVAAAVILPRYVDLPGINDSKKLSREVREKLALLIHKQAIAISIGCVSPVEIDRRNIYQASLEAMRLAVTGLEPAADYCLVDARTIPGVRLPQQALIHGDAVEGSIAAASIVAKVHRDKIMTDLEIEHPGYGFSRHMGYGTAVHLEALARLGASPIHRRSFGPVSAVLHSTSRRP